ncbi:MAG: flagellar basal-body rod protein FlgF [Beijerinckiaceae bacterium]
MENALLIGLSRQLSLAREADVIANNVANVTTNGFKARSHSFEEYLAPMARADAFPRGAQEVSYVLDRGIGLNIAQGAIEMTGNPLDVAIRGEGFFVVRTPAGERYTRDRAFALNASGELVTGSGARVLGENGPIAFSSQESKIEVGADGTITTSEVVRGRLRLVRFSNPQAMTSEGDNLFGSSQPALALGKDGKVESGAIERSNVRPVVEMTRLIEVSRAYQNVSSMIQRADELRRTAIQKLAEQPA